MTAGNAEIIYVDFKTKEVIEKPESDAPEEKFKTYNWIDSLTGMVYSFDSRVDTNEPMVEIPLWINTTEGMKQHPFTFAVKELIAIGEELSSKTQNEKEEAE